MVNKDLQSKVYADLYSASSRTRRRCATASRTSAMISVKLAIQPDTSPRARLRIRASVSRDIPVYSPNFRWVLISPTKREMAQTEWTRVPGSAPRWFTRPKTVTHPGTNRAWRRVTALIETSVLPLSQTGDLSPCINKLISGFGDMPWSVDHHKSACAFWESFFLLSQQMDGPVASRLMWHRHSRTRRF